MILQVALSNSHCDTDSLVKTEQNGFYFSVSTVPGTQPAPPRHVTLARITPQVQSRHVTQVPITQPAPTRHVTIPRKVLLKCP